MVIPYLNFNGNCAEALRFYGRVFDTQPSNLRAYNGYTQPGRAMAGLGEWIMHAEMVICGNRFWFADETGETCRGNMVRLTLAVDTVEKAREIFERLSSGGEIHMPPTDAFYSPLQAVLTDRFGVGWNIFVSSRESEVSGSLKSQSQQ